MEQRTYRVGHSRLTLAFGDLTASDAEALVSSDDYMLTMGGGVSAAIRRAGGESVRLDASKKIPAVLGDVVVTTAGSLPAKHVFHAITIGDSDADPREVVKKTTEKCLDLVETLGLHSIAFPAIGAGVAGFAYDDVAVDMAEVITAHLRASTRYLDVTLYLFDRFYTMQPIDFLKFFEEFAIRTRLQPEDSLPSREGGEEPMGEPALRAERPEVTARRQLARQLSDLESERDQLERRLVDFRGGASTRGTGDH